jgi:hypothetical protein
MFGCATLVYMFHKKKPEKPTVEEQSLLHRNRNRKRNRTEQERVEDRVEDREEERAEERAVESVIDIDVPKKDGREAWTIEENGESDEEKQNNGAEEGEER